MIKILLFSVRKLNRFFCRQDRDGDGRVTLEEWVTYLEETHITKRKKKKEAGVSSPVGSSCLVDRSIRTGATDWIVSSLTIYAG